MRTILVVVTLLLYSSGYADVPDAVVLPRKFTQMNFRQLAEPGHHGKWIEVRGYLYGAELVWYLSERKEGDPNRKMMGNSLMDLGPFGAMCRRFKYGAYVRVRGLYVQGNAILGHDGLGSFGFIESIANLDK